jgi:hypothetical protein
MNTEEVMCILLTRHSPSRISLSCNASSTCCVIFTNPTRAGRLNQSSLRYDFMFISCYQNSDPAEIIQPQVSQDFTLLLRRMVTLPFPDPCSALAKRNFFTTRPIKCPLPLGHVPVRVEGQVITTRNQDHQGEVGDPRRADPSIPTYCKPQIFNAKPRSRQERIGMSTFRQI